jgi:hypothetical protein
MFGAHSGEVFVRFISFHLIKRERGHELCNVRTKFFPLTLRGFADDDQLRIRKIRLREEAG